MQSDPLPVSTYIASLNHALRAQPARLIGEVSQLQLYPGRTYLFFSLKDAKSNAMIKCIMWKREYQLSGIELEEGMEIIITGFSEVYPANGSLTFKAQTAELVGEGALKKAYDKLKAQLEAEGVFSETKKRKIPSFAHNIGVITSRDGAVINDFLTNIGRRGYKISLIDSRVEGALATDELVRSVQSFNKKAEKGEIDTLIIIRGGGSLESLLPFNNEILVREVANFPVPVIAGIGHDKDITLVALAADRMVSTPTAVTALLNESWDRAESAVELWQNSLLSNFRDTLYRTQSEVNDLMTDIKSNFQNILERFTKTEYRIKEELANIKNQLSRTMTDMGRYSEIIIQKFTQTQRESNKLVETIEKQLVANDPSRLLKLGYSIVRSGGKVLKSVTQVKEGQLISVRLKDGEVESEVKKIS